MELLSVGSDLLFHRRPLVSPAASWVFPPFFYVSHHLGHQKSGERPLAFQEADCACIPTWKRCLLYHLKGQRQRKNKSQRQNKNIKKRNIQKHVQYFNMDII